MEICNNNIHDELIAIAVIFSSCIQQLYSAVVFSIKENGIGINENI